MVGNGGVAAGELVDDDATAARDNRAASSYVKLNSYTASGESDGDAWSVMGE